MRYSLRAIVAVIGCIYFIAGCLTINFLGSPLQSPLFGYRTRFRDITVSPDGQKIVFSFRTDVNAPFTKETAIYIINADGTDLRLLDHRNAENGIFHDLTWSSDSETIQYIHGQPDQSAYFKIQSDGQNRQDLTQQQFNANGDLVTPSANEFPIFYERYCLEDRDHNVDYHTFTGCENETLHFFQTGHDNLLFKIDPSDLIQPDQNVSILACIISSIAFIGILCGPLLPLSWLYHRRRQMMTST